MQCVLLEYCRLNNYLGKNKNRLMYFNLQVDYYSNEANKNKYKKRSVNSINKKQLNDCYRLYRALYLQRQLVILCCLDFKVLFCLGLLLLESIFIELESILLLESYVCFSKI